MTSSVDLDTSNRPCVLGGLSSGHLPILLSIPLSPAYHPNKRLSSFNFQKAHWDDVVSYFDFHYSSAEKYSSLSLSSAAALYLSGTECSQIFHSFQLHQMPS